MQMKKQKDNIWEIIQDNIKYKIKEKKEDEKRDDDLYNLGITVLRYSNHDINCNFNNVCEDILKHLELKSSDLTANNL